MNQPKFKGGQKLRCVLHDRVFTARVIRWTAELGWQYGEDTALYLEKHIHEYQEPQRKKLYAYSDGFGVLFQQSDRGERLRGEHGSLKRAPEYDIEYPSADA